MPDLSSADAKSVTAIGGKTNTPMPHESACKHVSGQAIYVDDYPPTRDQLFAYIGYSTIAKGRISSIDLSAVHQAEGVVDVITATDIPGDPYIGVIIPDEPLLAKDSVEYIGQSIFAVAATSYDLARKAVKLAKIEYAADVPILTIDDALDAENFIIPANIMNRGNVDAALEKVPNIIKGERYLKGQEHFYIEGQTSKAVPAEDGGVTLYPASQHANEIQKFAARILGIPMHLVTVEIRRMGGAFGGKEASASPLACLAALFAVRTQRAVSLRLARQDDMIMTGKRHDFQTSYRVGFDDAGQILAAEFTLSAKCGYSADLSPAVLERAMLSIDNAYYINDIRVIGNFCKTNTCSSTAFRGFGTPQAMVTIEGILDEIACKLGKDRLQVRRLNFYGGEERNTTHYQQKVEHNILPEIVDELEKEAQYQQRSEEIVHFNAHNRFVKKGIALTPLKYGVGYPIQFMNQAGALIHIYTDGSIHLNHGGTEMGQGILTKISQIVAEELQVDVNNIFSSSMRTDKVPNAMPSSGSFTTDLNGMAALNAARNLKTRLIDFAAEQFNVAKEDVVFINGEVHVGDTTLSFQEFVLLAHFNRIPLSSTGYFRTPKVHWDMEASVGRPYFYYVFGAAISEVIIDVFTGEYKVLRVDILHDVGRSLNQGIDMGQVEGGFIQGMGWLTTEELTWDDEGNLLSNNPSNYKIPTAGDVPAIFNARLLTGVRNLEETPFYSKAVGEPPLCLSISVWAALRHGISSIADYKILPRLEVPATPERVLWAIEAVKEPSACKEPSAYKEPSAFIKLSTFKEPITDNKSYCDKA